MREIFTYGSVGGALGNRCFYPETSNGKRQSADDGKEEIGKREEDVSS